MRRGTVVERSLLVFSLLALVGCTGLRSPRVAVGSVDTSAATQDALALDIVMELQNPNPTAVELFEFRYTLAIDGTHVFTGRRGGSANLSPKSTRQFTLPAVVNFDVVEWSLDALPDRCNYTLHGTLVYYAPNALAEILFDAGVRQPKVHFSSRGELSLR